MRIPRAPNYIPPKRRDIVSEVFQPLLQQVKTPPTQPPPQDRRELLAQHIKDALVRHRENREAKANQPRQRITLQRPPTLAEIKQAELLARAPPPLETTTSLPYSPAGAKAWSHPVRELENKRFRILAYEYRNVPFTPEDVSSLLKDIIRNLPTHNQYFFTLKGTIEIRTQQGSRDQTLTSNQRMPHESTAMTLREQTEHLHGRRFHRRAPDRSIEQFVADYMARFEEYMTRIAVKSDVELDVPDVFKYLRIMVREVSGGGSLIDMHPDCKQYLYNPQHHTLCLLYCLQQAGIDVSHHINDPTALYQHLNLPINCPIPVKKIKHAI